MVAAGQSGRGGGWRRASARLGWRRLVAHGSLSLACGAGLGCGGGGDTSTPTTNAESARPAPNAEPGPASADPSSPGAGPTSPAESDVPLTAFPQAQPSSAALDTRLARLSHTQYLRTVRDLVGVDDLDAAFAPDALNGFAFDTSQNLRVDARLGPQYRAMAERLADRVVTDETLLGRVVGCDPAAPACADQFIASFGERAFRRPLAPEEAATFRQLFDAGAELVQSGDAFRDGVRLALEGFLQSPQFLYRTEAGLAPGADGRIALDDWEVASRLSYFLYDSMPDAELFEAARSGQLQTPEQIEAAARRMLTQPRVLDKLVSFHEQAWQFGRFSRISPDTATYPNVPSGFVNRVRESAAAFVQDVIASGGGLEELLTAPYAFVDDGLAPLYGVSVPGASVPGDGNTASTGAGMSRVDFPGGERQGLLMQVGFLAANAYSIRTDPIHRGLFVQRNVLCRTIPDPPPGASTTPLPPTDEPIETTREEISLLTGQSYCPACHSQINPPGFAFEGFDAIGQARETENGVPVDTSAEMVLDGQLVSFEGPAQLTELLARSQEAHRCYAARWIEFTYGRPLALDDVPTWDAMAGESLPIADIVVALVKSPAFTSLNATGLDATGSNAEVTP